jgi:hypothetical protein
VHTIWATNMRLLIRKQAIVGSLVIVFLFQAIPSKADQPSSFQTIVVSENPDTNSQQDEIKQLRERVQILEEKQAEQELRPKFGMNLGVFGDVNFFTENREGSHPAFVLGPLDLYSTGNYGPRLNFLAELQLEIGGNSEGHIDIERLWVGYTFSDLLIVRAGRQHTALGYWNKAYHHAKQHFLTVDRPFFLAFEDDGGILPVHTVGIELSGAKTLNGNRWMYELDIGNGHRIDPNTRLLVPNQVSDNNSSKQVAIRLSTQPDRVPGLTIGLFGTNDRMGIQANQNLDERIYGTDISYVQSGVEFIAEYFKLLNLEKQADAYYIQFGYKIAHDLTPYTRYETLNVERTDPYFLELQNNVDRYQEIVGLRYDIDELRSALKFQLRHDHKEGSETFNVLEAQWSFSF